MCSSPFVAVHTTRATISSPPLTTTCRYLVPDRYIELYTYVHFYFSFFSSHAIIIIHTAKSYFRVNCMAHWAVSVKDDIPPPAVRSSHQLRYSPFTTATSKQTTTISSSSTYYLVDHERQTLVTPII